MKLSDFIVLNHQDKKGILLHQGVLVAKRRTEDHIIFLFQLEGFYVESVCKVDSKAVEEFRSFTTARLLEPYLNTISLEGIVD